MKKQMLRSVYLFLVLLLLATAVPARASGTGSGPDGGAGDVADRKAPARPLQRAQAHPDRIIVKFEPATSRAARENIRRQEGLDRVRGLGLIRAEVVRVRGRSAEEAVRALNRRGDVEYASLDYIRRASGYADEPRFGEQWGNHNTGQTIEGVAGTADIDTNAPEASARTLGDPDLVVAVVDDGVDFSHPDLTERRWVNPGESGTDASGADKASNGVDDDGNGYVDDVNGWDFCNGDNTVFDAVQGDAHGTHVAGTLAASVNGQGIAGMAPNIRVMALKFICGAGGADSDIIQAWEYAQRKGVRLVNNSWGGGFPSPAIEEFVVGSPMFFVFAAGNEGSPSASFPAMLDRPNILSVAALDNTGVLAPYSNYSDDNVDVAAPGSSVLSSVPATPERSGLTLSTYATGKAVVAGFGVEEISGREQRAVFIGRALDAVGRTTEPVMLIDDDQSYDLWLGLPDTRPRLSQAILDATGVAPEVVEVYGGDGPWPSELSGKVVIWSTGWAFDSGNSNMPHPLTTGNESFFTQHLSNGGKLILTGLDVLAGKEDTLFAQDVLGLEVTHDVGGRGGERLTGTAGTAFAGEMWEIAYDPSTNPYALPPYHDMLTPGGSSTVSLGVYPELTAGYEYWDGTSMAAPYATGAAALVASVAPGMLGRPHDLRTLLMNGSKAVPVTVGKTVSGRMIDAGAALAALSDSAQPSGTVRIDPDDGLEHTVSRSVQLLVAATDGAGGSGTAWMRFSNDGTRWAGWVPYHRWYPSWELTSGDGRKTVYAQFRDAAGNVSATAKDDVLRDSMPPRMTAPKPTLIPQATLYDAGPVPVWIKWTGSDAGSGVARYELQRSRDKGATYTQVTLSSATTTNVKLPLAPVSSNTYRFRARGTDKVGHVSQWATGAAFTLASIPESSPQVAYAGRWTPQSASSAYGDTLRHASSAGATARCSITGARQVAWISTLNPNRGKARVRLYQGSALVEERIVDTYAATFRPRKLVYTRAGLDPAREYRLVVYVLGQRNVASTANRVDVDGFIAIR